MASVPPFEPNAPAMRKERRPSVTTALQSWTLSAASMVVQVPSLMPTFGPVLVLRWKSEVNVTVSPALLEFGLVPSNWVGAGLSMPWASTLTSLSTSRVV